MSDTPVEAALSVILDDLPLVDEPDYRTAILDRLDGIGANVRALEAIDRSLIPDDSEEGFAFHWEDMFDLGDVWDAVVSLRAGLDPIEMSNLVVTLLGSWRRLRGVRVPLSKEEFFVLRAVRKGHTDAVSVANYAKLSLEVVNETIEALRNKKYKREIPLLAISDAGLATQF